MFDRAAPTSAPVNLTRDVVFTFNLESWTNAAGGARYMTGPRLMTTLLSEPSVRKLLVANPYHSIPIHWAKRLIGKRPPPFPTVNGRALVEPMRIRRRDPTSVRALERAYIAYDRALETAAAALGADRPAVITTNPFVAGFSPLRWAGQVTFYAWDDWPSGQAVRRWWTAYEVAFARIRESRRAVVGVSQGVVDGIRPTGPMAVVPNGLVPEEWRRIDPPPTWFAKLPSPRILYIGAMVAERLDVQALCETAERFPNGTLVLVGRVDDRGLLDPLGRYPNVCVHQPVGRTEIASIVRGADVCILPHLFTRMTAAMSPLKLYEYLAAGRPVAASDLPPVRAVDPRIVCVREGDSFADGVEEALRRGPLAEADRLAFIDANSWARRHAQILQIAFGLPEPQQVREGLDMGSQNDISPSTTQARAITRVGQM